MRDRKWMRRSRSSVASLPLVFVILGWFIIFRPSALGGPASYVVVSGVSMEPTIHSGALAIVFSEREYAIGDIVAYRVGSGYVIHRIVGRDTEGFVLQGDNKDYSDPWKPTPDDIVGKMWLQIQDGGRVVAYLRQPMLLAPLVGTMAMVFILFPGGRQLTRRRKTKDLIRQRPSPAFDFSIEPSQENQTPHLRLSGIVERGPMPVSSTSKAKKLFDSGSVFQPRRLQHPLPPGMEVYAVQSESRLRWEYVLDLRSPSRVNRRP